MRTSPGPGIGRATSTTCNTSMSPYSAKRTALGMAPSSTLVLLDQRMRRARDTTAGPAAHSPPPRFRRVRVVTPGLAKKEATMPRTHDPVAVLGIGTMGHGMATSALRAGIPTIVWNREPKATQDLSNLGAEVAPSPADAARRAAIVVTMVTDADAVISIARDQGMLAALAADAIWVQMSTIGVAGIQRVAALVEKERPDVTLLDAPVSGSKDPAEHGQL